jgi:hypothetical protein
MSAKASGNKPGNSPVPMVETQNQAPARAETRKSAPWAATHRVRMPMPIGVPLSSGGGGDGGGN